MRYISCFLMDVSLLRNIRLNSDKEVVQVAVNNAIRDSHLDLPANKVKTFYSALKLFNDILYDNSANFKMDSGKFYWSIGTVIWWCIYDQIVLITSDEFITFHLIGNLINYYILYYRQILYMLVQQKRETIQL